MALGVGRGGKLLALKKRKMISGSHVNYWEERGGMGLEKANTWTYETRKREVEVKKEKQWEFNCYDAMVVSDSIAKIISIKIQTELILITWKLAKKGKGVRVKKAVCPVVHILQRYLE